MGAEETEAEKQKGGGEGEDEEDGVRRKPADRLHQEGREQNQTHLKVETWVEAWVEMWVETWVETWVEMWLCPGRGQIFASLLFKNLIC